MKLKRLKEFRLKDFMMLYINQGNQLEIIQLKKKKNPCSLVFRSFRKHV
jgi:hypothetical protein